MSELPLVPPLNFSLVADGVYRSGHPLEINYAFLQRLHLKTIIYIGDRPDKDNQEYRKWAKDQGIDLICYHVKSVKEPFIQNDSRALSAALEILLDVRNFPVLVHSNKGKHRVGVLIGLMRKMLQGWSLATIFDEYSRFAFGKGDADVEFIELYQPVLTYDPQYSPKWLRV